MNSMKAEAVPGAVRIAVLSDSHGSLPRSVFPHLQGCSCILHAGDIVRESDLDELALYGSLYAVRGNCDRWVPRLQDLAGVLRFMIGGVSFCMTHDPMDVPRDLGGVDVFVYGHTHQYRAETEDGVLWLNPGSCGRPRYGGEPTMAVLAVKDGKILTVTRIGLRD